MEDWRFYYNQGLAFKAQGELRKSAEYHLKVLQLAPDLAFPEAWHNAGAALLRIDTVDEAVPYLQRALKEYDQAIQERKDKAAYYLFWKACVYALLKDKQRMLSSLQMCFTENDGYAKDALYEEDLAAYKQDEDFRSLLDPIVTVIEALTFRGKSLSKADVSEQQLQWHAAFVTRLAQEGWQKDSLLTDAFQWASVSPQAMYEYCSNAVFCLRLSIHLDTCLLFLELWDQHDTEEVKQLRLYYDPALMLENIPSTIGVICKYQHRLNNENWVELVKELFPVCKELQLQDLDGSRYTIK